eukprot:GHVU01079198.1.p1 GENE.GHVU01079198.1~~GHVU01079198.1.p1  ORF type:complete len:314 (-),score=53.72 GHVU01079198.1:218-1159(-)
MASASGQRSDNDGSGGGVRGHPPTTRQEVGGSTAASRLGIGGRGRAPAHLYGILKAFPLGSWVRGAASTTASPVMPPNASGSNAGEGGASSSAAAIPTSAVGWRYRLERVISYGAHGVVYKASGFLSSSSKQETSSGKEEGTSLPPGRAAADHHALPQEPLLRSLNKGTTAAAAGRRQQAESSGKSCAVKIVDLTMCGGVAGATRGGVYVGSSHGPAAAAIHYHGTPSPSPSGHHYHHAHHRHFADFGGGGGGRGGDGGGNAGAGNAGRVFTAAAAPGAQEGRGGRFDARLLDRVFLEGALLACCGWHPNIVE